MRTDPLKAAIAFLSAGALAFLAGCAGGGFEGTARCVATVAEVVYDPNEKVEIIHAHPTHSSKSGEAFADGSALYLVTEEGQTIIASASISDASAGGSLQYSREHCTPL